MDDRDPPVAPATTNPVPFVIALVVFLFVAALAVVFLRDDTRGRLVPPDGIQVVDADTVRLRYDGPFPDGYAEITAVGFAIGDDVVLVELVVDDHGCTDDCTPPTGSLTVDLVLPEPVAGRDVRRGTGRSLAECDPTAGDVPVCR